MKLLDGQDGQYMIGSVHFAKPGEAIPGVAMDAANTSESAFQPGVSSRPALDSVMASARGQALLNSQVYQTIPAPDPSDLFKAFVLNVNVANDVKWVCRCSHHTPDLLYSETAPHNAYSALAVHGLCL